MNKMRGFVQCNYGKGEYYENIMRAREYNYPLHFDIHILPDVRVMHTKGEWHICLSWLLWFVSVWIMRPIYVYQVLFYGDSPFHGDSEKPNPMVNVRTFNNLREAVRFSLEVDGAIRRAE